MDFKVFNSDLNKKLHERGQFQNITFDYLRLQFTSVRFRRENVRRRFE